jgi:glucose-1-phosphate thymidylyltransferase
MDAILLAGGYGTRLYPLTKDRPKALLPVAGKPILNYVVEELEGSEHIERMYLVTNEKFADDFARWEEDREGGKPLTVLNDGTTSNEDRLGAIGDIKFVLDNSDVRTEEGVYALGTDNLANFNITAIVDLALERGASAVFASRIEDRQRLCRMGVAQLDEDGRLVDFVEKPDEPPSNLAVPPFYVYSPEAVQLLPRYLEEGNDPDAPGHFIEWLIDRSPVYACVTEKKVCDIGTPRAYEEVQREYGGIE